MRKRHDVSASWAASVRFGRMGAALRRLLVAGCLALALAVPIAQRSWAKPAYPAPGARPPGGPGSQPSGDSEVGARQCRDGAARIAAGPWDSGEPSVRAIPNAPGRLVASWQADPGEPAPPGSAALNWPRPDVVSGPARSARQPTDLETRITFSWLLVVLAQRDAQGNWIKQGVGMGRDPWLDVSPSGVAYVSYVDLVRGPYAMVRRVIPGKRASRRIALPLPNFPDHPSLAADQRSFPDGDHLYVVAGAGTSLSLTVSSDGGKHWGSPVPVPQSEGSYPVVASGGDHTIVGWLESGQGIRVARYDDAERRFYPPVDPSGSALIAALDREGRSPSQGWGWGGSLKPSLAVVPDGPLAGTAYVAWYESTGGGGTDIFVSISTNGLTWTHPVRVNEKGDPSTYRAFPSVSTDENGNAVVAWMDGRDDPSGATLQVYAASVDAEGHVGPNRRLTDCPTFGQTQHHHLGDYLNFDVAGGKLEMVYPQIREPEGDSDVFYQGWAWP